MLCALLAGCGVLLIVHRAKFRPELNVILLAFGVCLTLASMFLAVHEATDNVSALPMAVALLVTVFIDALTAFALLFLTRECQTKTILRFVCTVIVVCVGIMLLINIMKVPWCRARMRLIYSPGNDTYFTNWWQGTLNECIGTEFTIEAEGEYLVFLNFPQPLPQSTR